MSMGNNHALKPDGSIDFPVVGVAIGIAAKIVLDAGYSRSQFLRMMAQAWEVMTTPEFTESRD